MFTLGIHKVNTVKIKLNEHKSKQTKLHCLYTVSTFRFSVTQGKLITCYWYASHVTCIIDNSQYNLVSLDPAMNKKTRWISYINIFNFEYIQSKHSHNYIINNK